MISRALARQHIAKFSGKRGYPKEREALKVLIDAFEQAPSSESHAEQMADDLQVDTPFAPTAHEIWRVAQSTRPARKMKGCKQCYDMGMVEVEKAHNGKTYTAAVPCPKCRRVASGVEFYR